MDEAIKILEAILKKRFTAGNENLMEASETALGHLLDHISPPPGVIEATGLLNEATESELTGDRLIEVMERCLGLLYQAANPPTLGASAQETIQTQDRFG